VNFQWNNHKNDHTCDTCDTANRNIIDHISVVAKEIRLHHRYIYQIMRISVRTYLLGVERRTGRGRGGFRESVIPEACSVACSLVISRYDKSICEKRMLLFSAFLTTETAILKVQGKLKNRTAAEPTARHRNNKPKKLLQDQVLPAQRHPNVPCIVSP
jgi:hypothetical protein